MLHSRLIIWMLGISLFLASCTDNSRYVQALPKDAALVSSVNLGSLFVKSGLQHGRGEVFAAKLKTALGSGLEGSQQLVERILQDSSVSGLDLSDKLYFFVGAHSASTGILIRIADQGKLRDLLDALKEQQVCEAPRESDGCRWTTAGRVLIAYSDVALLIMAHPQGGNPEDLQHQAAMLLRQGKEDGFVASSDYEKMHVAQGDIITIASLNMLPQKYVAPLTMGMSAELKLQDVKALAVIDFQMGKAVMDIQTLITDKVIIGQTQKLLEGSGNVKGDYLDKFPANTGFWTAANIDGKKIYALLNENPTISRQFRHSMIPLDFQTIFESIKGDVVLAMPDPLRSRAFIAYADVTNRNFLQTFEDLRPLLAMTGGQMQLLSQGADAYEFRMIDASALNLGTGPAVFWFGVKDGQFYITNHEELIGKRVLGLSLRDTKWGREVEGKCMFAALNLAPVIQGTEYLTIASPDGLNAHLELVMKNQEVNVLQQLLQIAGF